MTKIIVPERKIETFREFKVEEGELILLLTGGRTDDSGLVRAAILGIFNGILEEDNSEYRQKYGARYYDKNYLKISNTMLLKHCTRFGNVSLPCLEKYDKTHIWITKSIKQIYSPQDVIVKQLQGMQGFEPHAEWVSRLRKPYLE